MIQVSYLVVEDDSDERKTIIEHIRSVVNELKSTGQDQIAVTEIEECDTFERFEELNNHNGDTGPDIIVLDLKLGTVEIEKTISESNFIRRKEKLVIFIVYTAFGSDPQVKQLENVLYRVVVKGSDGIRKWLKSYSSLIINLKKFESEISVQMKKLRNESAAALLGVSEEELPDEQGLVEITKARLVSYLMNYPLSADEPVNNAVLSAAETIIFPPLRASDDGTLPIAMGDIMKDQAGKRWVVISPTCDLMIRKNGKPKTDSVIALRSFDSVDEILKWKEMNINKWRVIDDNKDTRRLYRVPSTISSGKVILVHTRCLKVFLFDDIKGFEKLATIATPYAEELQNAFARDVSRIGVPDVSPPQEDLWKSFKGDRN